MLKKVINLTLALSFVISAFSINVPAKEDISESLCAIDFAYVDETGINEVPEPVSKGKIKATATLVRADESTKEIPYVFSILTYQNGKIGVLESKEGKMSSDKTEIPIETPVITLPENVTGLRIWSMITSPDFVSALVPQATMGSQENEVKRISVAGYDIPLEEDKYEYDMTIYLREDKFPMKVLVWTKDLSADVKIENESDDNDYTYTITSTASAGGEPVVYTLNIKAYKMNETSLTGVSYKYSYGEGDNKVVVTKEMKDFNPDLDTFVFDIEEKETVVPEIIASTFDRNSTVTYEHPKALPGNGKITVESKDGKSRVYTVKFGKIKTTEPLTYTGAAMAGGNVQSYDSMASSSRWFGDGIYALRLNGAGREAYLKYNIDETKKINIVSAELSVTAARNYSAVDALDGCSIYAYQNIFDYDEIIDKFRNDNKTTTLGAIAESSSDNLLASYTVTSEDAINDSEKAKLGFPSNGYTLRKIKAMQLDASKMQIYDENTIIIYFKDDNTTTKDTYYVPPKLTVKYVIYAD